MYCSINEAWNTDTTWAMNRTGTSMVKNTDCSESADNGLSDYSFFNDFNSIEPKNHKQSKNHEHSKNHEQIKKEQTKNRPIKTHINRIKCADAYNHIVNCKYCHYKFKQSDSFLSNDNNVIILILVTGTLIFLILDIFIRISKH